MNKVVRAKLAKETINVVIPRILKNNPRAQKGVRSSELIRFSPSKSTAQPHPKAGKRTKEANSSQPTTEVDLPAVEDNIGDTDPAVMPTTHSSSTITANVLEALEELDAVTASKNPTPNPFQTIAAMQCNPGDTEPSGVTRPTSISLHTRPSHLKIRVVQSDTYDAVKSLLGSSPVDPGSSRIAALNMCSIYTPGGGVLRGTLAQEESLCLRSTLHPSLSSSYYRLPDLSAIYSPDILIFRSSDLTDLPKSEWFFTNVISVAALKQPETKGNVEGKLVYAEEKDRECMVEKVRMIFSAAQEKGVRRLVLGALGCGAYGNPKEEVAKIFKKVIFGDRKRSGVEAIDEIVFAIFDDGRNIKAFREVFKDVLE